MLLGIEVPPPVGSGTDGQLVYRADEKGNRVPDFSFAGYSAGGIALPAVASRVSVSPVSGDNTTRIQAAIDFVSQLAPEASGFCGAVFLRKGRFEVAGKLRINTSGVVLRGEGAGENGTVLIATGTERRALVEVRGKNDRAADAAKRAVTESYVPVGATKLHVDLADQLKVGATVFIERPSTREWIASIGMDHAPGPSPFMWKPGSLNVRWDRVVMAIRGDEVTLDAPLTTALDARLGGATLAAYKWPGRIERVGVENLRCISACDAANPRDEEHAWMAITLDNVQDAWVRGVTGEHFVSSVVQVGEGCKCVTVQDCSSLAPVSEMGGHRRHSFHTSGQLTLFQRCCAEDGRNDFTVGYVAAGPNVFLDCEALNTHGFSGSLGSWASGVLFDNVRIDGGELRLDNLETWNQGVGWCAANSMIWQTNASRVICRSPPGAANWAVGTWGQFVGDGQWSAMNAFVKPASLYRAQLAERLGEDAVAQLAERPDFSGDENAPPLETMLPDLAARLAFVPEPVGKPLALVNGWLTTNDRALIGKNINTAWWRGNLVPGRGEEVGPALTRFAPGRIGLGYTDDLNELTDAMVAANQVTFRHDWGLWYDRRSDDHERTRRPDSEVWPPFFEQPWARSGFIEKGEAWDRLTRYDLSKFNPWYFSRLREFAKVGRARGRVLINEMYFQHNLLEAGAHWAHFPWRPANNINDTGFPEPPLYKENDGSDAQAPEMGKRIFMAELFYDTSHPARRELHRAYIRQCLANLADEPNVIHTTGEEFTGPLAFVQFWLDTVAEWKTETGKHPLIALSAPKDVQDAILADPKRSRLISVIDLKYWWRTEKGLFAPPAGQNLAPRQSERLWKGGKPSAAMLAGMVREYREKFPDKAVISPLEQGDGWAFLAAGGSFPALPATTDEHLLAALPRMLPIKDAVDGIWTLGEPRIQYFVFSLRGGDVAVNVGDARGEFTIHHIDLRDGKVTGEEPAAKVSNGTVMVPLPENQPAAVWLTR